ncbi:hypothetical protein KIL84_004687 [Mauremys mutica]|uniref:Uncharacterized protein n=1 Tax=Mauremys mutica TaxID=74926 RepID=A0A9D4B7F7_9SAUR|nr:hypothetical protein KIL84_004687 [Mauremys mutica]
MQNSQGANILVIIEHPVLTCRLGSEYSTTAAREDLSLEMAIFLLQGNRSELFHLHFFLIEDESKARTKNKRKVLMLSRVYASSRTICSEQKLAACLLTAQSLQIERCSMQKTEA